MPILAVKTFIFYAITVDLLEKQLSYHIFIFKFFVLNQTMLTPSWKNMNLAGDTFRKVLNVSNLLKIKTCVFPIG